MARDYKHRAQSRDADNRRRKTQESSLVGLFKWMLMTALIIGFVVFFGVLKKPCFPKNSGYSGRKSSKVSKRPQLPKPTNRGRMIR